MLLAVGGAVVAAVAATHALLSHWRPRVALMLFAGLVSAPQSALVYSSFQQTIATLAPCR
jgi:hypothetical protein